MITASSATEIASLILSSLLMVSPPLIGEESRQPTAFFCRDYSKQIFRCKVLVDEMIFCDYNLSVNDFWKLKKDSRFSNVDYPLVDINFLDVPLVLRLIFYVSS
jgi:hypothetical protein